MSSSARARLAIPSAIPSPKYIIVPHSGRLHFGWSRSREERGDAGGCREGGRGRAREQEPDEAAAHGEAMFPPTWGGP